MLPINQVILNSDPLLTNTQNTIEEQLKQLELRKQTLENIRQNSIASPIPVLWNEIDKEIMSLSTTQKSKLLEDKEYVAIYSSIQDMVSNELLNLVKVKIESSTEGNTLLKKQLEVLKRIKTKIIEDTDKEIVMFNRFKEYSKSNPNITYEEFLKVYNK